MVQLCKWFSYDIQVILNNYEQVILNNYELPRITCKMTLSYQNLKKSANSAINQNGIYNLSQSMPIQQLIKMAFTIYLNPCPSNN